MMKYLLHEAWQSSKYAEIWKKCWITCHQSVCVCSHTWHLHCMCYAYCMLLASELRIHTYVCTYPCCHYLGRVSLDCAQALPIMQSCQYIQTSSLDNSHFHSTFVWNGNRHWVYMRLQTLHHHAGFTPLGLRWGGSGRLDCACLGCEAGKILVLGNNLSLLFPILPHFEGRSCDNWSHYIHWHCIPNMSIPDIGG